MKAIVLTYAPVQESEQEILRNTDIFKLALNQHAEEFKPNVRMCSDWNLKYLLSHFPEKIISVRDRLRCPSNRVEYTDVEFKGSTIICALEWLKSKGYDEILIVGDNSVNHEGFRNEVNLWIDQYGQEINIYQYSKGNFNLPLKNITDFVK